MHALSLLLVVVVTFNISTYFSLGKLMNRASNAVLKIEAVQALWKI
jgi:hypothetical protein